MLARLMLFVSLVFPVPAHATERPPNVVLVMTDDQGYGDLACHGNPVLKTPQLDRLYATSVRLTDYHVSPTCSPTRAALMTGRYCNRTGVWHTILGRSLLREDELTMGELFRRAGYATGMFGKWHLGDNVPCRAEDRGFETVLRCGGGGVSQTPDFWDNAYFDGSYWSNGTPVPVEGFCTDVFTRAAEAFILEAKRRERPFLCYLATNAAHGPMHAPEAFAAPYAEHETQLANFYGMIANIDANVGRLRALLEREGLAENTIFVFTTDNGTAAGERIWNAGMRGKKGSEYDGGHRVPCFVHWPAGGFVGGRDVDGITAHVDVLPTLLDLCGIERPEGLRLDGRSLRPLLVPEHPDRDAWQHRVVITDSQRVRDPIMWRKSAVMTSRWRLVNGRELFDMNVDPSQAQDVATTHQDVVERLRHAYTAWWQDIEPTFARDVNLWLGDPRENPVRLTAHDLVADGTTPWNQAQVRQGAHAKGMLGHWNVDVRRAGKYTFRLRRWPPEIDHPLTAGLAPGAEVPGAQALRARPGAALNLVRAHITIANIERESELQEGMTFAAFDLDLPRGTTQLEARFFTADGTEYPAYFVDVIAR